MAVVPIQAIATRGQAVSFANSASGDQVQVGRDKVLLAWNSGGSPNTVTLAVPGTDDITGAAKPDNAETVAAGEIRIIPLDNRYADSSIGGLCALSYGTPGATLKVAAISVV